MRSLRDLLIKVMFRFAAGQALITFWEVCHMNRIDICKNIIQSINNYISDPYKLEAHRAPNRFIRKRKLSMKDVIMYLVFSSKASMHQNLSSIHQLLPELSFPNISKQALSKARQFISPDLFKELFYLSVDSFYNNNSSRSTWHGLHLFAIDGSKFELPNSPSNFEFFGEMFGYPYVDRRYTMGLGSMIYDVLDDYIVHASFHHFLASERSAAIEHLRSLEDLGIYENSIVIFDRGYYSEKFFKYCVDNNHLCLIRLKERLKISKACNGDTVMPLTMDKSNDASCINVRVIEVTLDDGSKEYLATNLFDQTFTADMFKELYFKRWPVETKFKELKSYFSIEDFNGATPTSIFQEFYINLLLSNLVSLIKNQTDIEIESRINSKKVNKYRYQANRSFIIGQIKFIIPKLLCNSFDYSILDHLLLEAFQARTQIQPGRKYKRQRSKLHGRSHFRNKKVAF